MISQQQPPNERAAENPAQNPVEYPAAHAAALSRRRLPAPFWATFFSLFLLALAVLVPLPLVVFSPGPIFDVLGKQGDSAVVEIIPPPAEETADTGQLLITTISERGGPGSTVTAAHVVQAWLSPSSTVHRYSDVYTDDISPEEAMKYQQIQMESSHSTASVAALEYLGYQVPAVITVEGVEEGRGAEGILEPGDVLVSVKTPNGQLHPMDSPSAPFELLSHVPAGTALGVTVKREGEVRNFTVVTSPATDTNVEDDADADADADADGSKLGIFLSFDIDMPVEVAFHLEKVGGPSAGMIFALAVIDKMGERNLTGGQLVAGTGAVTYDGLITPIGGIKQKMFAAKDGGAPWFLAPKDNCSQVVGNVPAGLSVFAVSTLDEAVSAVDAIAAGETDSLPTCDLVVEAAGQ